MRLPGFDYIRPIKLSEAYSTLAEHKNEALIVAGGTDILVSMKQRIKTPKYLLGLNNIDELNHISENGNEIRIGAATTLETIEKSTLIQKHFPCLATAAGKVGTWQLRNMGTIGGNICLDTRCFHYNQSKFWRSTEGPCYKLGGEQCHIVKKGDRCYALFSADTVPSLVALGASIKVGSIKGERTIKLEEFYTGDGKSINNIGGEEILTEVSIPKQSQSSKGIYLKFSYRDTFDFPVIGVAVVVECDRKEPNICKKVDIILGGVDSRPVRIRKTESLINGQELKKDIIEEASHQSTKEVKLVSHMNISAAYKREMVGVLLEEALTSLKNLQ